MTILRESEQPGRKPVLMADSYRALAGRGWSTPASARFSSLRGEEPTRSATALHAVFIRALAGGGEWCLRPFSFRVWGSWEPH